MIRVHGKLTIKYIIKSNSKHYSNNISWLNNKSRYDIVVYPPPLILREVRKSFLLFESICPFCISTCCPEEDPPDIDAHGVLVNHVQVYRPYKSFQNKS